MPFIGFCYDFVALGTIFVLYIYSKLPSIKKLLLKVIQGSTSMEFEKLDKICLKIILMKIASFVINFLPSSAATMKRDFAYMLHCGK